MKTKPVTATLDEDLVAEAKTRVGRRQLSRYLNEALALRLQHDRLAELEAELTAEFGPIPEEIRAVVDEMEWPR